MKFFKFVFCFAFLISCNNDSRKSELSLSNFIKPEYSSKESSFKCNLLEGRTLNAVERFIPKFIDSYTQVSNSTEEIFFLFPVNEDEIETQYFEVLLKHEEELSLDNFKMTLADLSFNEVASCSSSTTSDNSLYLTKETIYHSPVVVEILECEYLDEFNYATLKLVIEQFADALSRNQSPVDLIYSENEDIDRYFKWTNIFSSLKTRREFVESWKELEVSKEIQSLLLEQTICQSTALYRRYKVL